MDAVIDPVLIDLDAPGHGPAAVVKNSIDVEALPTRCGSCAFADADASPVGAGVVVRLRAAGWRIAGKARFHWLAFGATGINAQDGTPVNPRWPALVPGGSSSGSAVAVAAGLISVAPGADMGGSIRVPAACCGIFGLMPTFGLVSRRGVLPVESSLDCVGPMASGIDTLVRAMCSLVPGFALPAIFKPIRVGVLRVNADAVGARTVHSGLRAWVHAGGVSLHGVESLSFAAAHRAGLTLINAETRSAYGHLITTDRLGADIASRRRAASEGAAAMLAEANEVRSRFRFEIDTLLAVHDVLALPTIPPRGVDAADTLVAVGMTSLVRPFNLSGHPAITLPLSSSERGPVGLQIVAARGQGALLCANARSAARALQHRVVPPHSGEKMC